MTLTELHARLQHVDAGTCTYSLSRCAALLPKIERVLALKKERGAVLLAHTYVAPEIAAAADFVGDSYYLAEQAKNSGAKLLVFAAVRFMAETAKIVNPECTVLDPNPDGGCTLADSITGPEVAELRRQYPDHAFVCYINTTAAVKAECDVCVTSSNVYQIVERLEADSIFFLPDRLMAMNILDHLREEGIDKELTWSAGSCYVHESYDPEAIDLLRHRYDGKLAVAVHPECNPAVVGKADFVGSTAGISRFVRETSHPRYALVTECGLSARIQSELPEKKLVGSCTFCRYMQANSLDSIIAALEDRSDRYAVQLDPATAGRARASLERMFELAKA